MCGKKFSILYIGPCNTVILKLLKSNTNLQFVTGVYAMLTYLTSYLCKPEHAMTELMKKTSEEAYGKNIKGKMLSIGNMYLTKHEVFTHEAIEAFKYRCPACFYRSKKQKNYNVKVFINFRKDAP